MNKIKTFVSPGFSMMEKQIEKWLFLHPTIKISSTTHCTVNEHGKYLHHYTIIYKELK